MAARRGLQGILALTALVLFVLVLVPGEAWAFQRQAGRQLSGPSQAPASPQAPPSLPSPGHTNPSLGTMPKPGQQPQGTVPAEMMPLSLKGQPQPSLGKAGPVKLPGLNPGTLEPSPGGTSLGPGSGGGQADSFFDVTTEIPSKPELSEEAAKAALGTPKTGDGSFNVDSFFDVTTELPGPPPKAALAPQEGVSPTGFGVGGLGSQKPSEGNMELAPQSAGPKGKMPFPPPSESKKVLLPGEPNMGVIVPKKPGHGGAKATLVNPPVLQHQVPEQDVLHVKVPEQDVLHVKVPEQDVLHVEVPEQEVLYVEDPPDD